MYNKFMHLNIRRLFIALLFIGLLLMTFRPIADPDFWWHLRTGELIVQTHSIPHSDPFSFTNNGKPWLTHEWLTEIFMYALFRLGSYALLIAVFSLIITAAFILAYLRCPQESRPYVAGFSVFLGALATGPTWGVRPQMISLLLTSLFLLLLDRYFQKGKLAYILALPPLTLLWVNMHAGYLLGLAVVACFIVGGLLEILASMVWKSRPVQPPSLKSILTLSAVLGVSILATLANPNSYHILLYPFQTLTSSSMQQLIVEWFSPDFHLLQWQPFAWMILLLIGAGMLSRKSISMTNIILVLLLGYAGLRSMRNIPLFAIAAIPVLAEQVGSFVHIPLGDQKPSHLYRILAPVLVVLLSLVAVFHFVQVVQGQAKSEAQSFPKAAVDWIASKKPVGNMYNTYGWGGYLIWRLYPEYKVYIDGRADVYGDKFLYDFISIEHAESGWAGKLQEQQVNTVFIAPDSALAKVLLLSPGWKIAFQDGMSIIFIRE